MNPILKNTAIASAAIVLAAAGFVYWGLHANVSELPSEATTGKNPQLVEPKAQWVPSMKLAKTVGWAAGETPQAAAGLAVTRFADGLDHPRTMLTLPNGDVLVTETNAPPHEGSPGVTGFIKDLVMGRVGAGDPSPNRIVLLRDGDGDGKAEGRFVLRSAGLRSPSGMAWRDGKLYVANHDAVYEYAFQPGATRLEGKPLRKMIEVPGGGHWMRNLLLSPDGKHLYVAVGSKTNIADDGMEAEAGRAMIWEVDVATARRRQFGIGLRNPNGMGWNPSTGEMWATVQERDMLGPDLVPDYLTNVPVGANYGWPWVYWKTTFDERVQWPMQTYMAEYTRKPEYAMGAHVSALGLTFANGGNRMGKGYENGVFIARHGSWNRRPAAGYDVVFVPFDANGNPRDVKPRPVLTGFLKNDGDTRGRPTWVAWDKGGALLVSDDTAGVIWRVIAPGAQPSPRIEPVVTEHLRPREDIKDPNAPAELMGGFRKEDDKLLP